MPGYNVVGPAEAFSTTLEDAILKHEVAQHQAKIAERQAKLDQAKLSQDKAYLELAQKQQENQQEDRKTALAEKAAAAKEKEGTDIAGRLVTGDVITPDIAKVLPPGLTVPGTPATPAVPAGPNTAPLAGTSIPMERDVANATPAVAAAPPTFRGLPAARIAAQKTSAEQALEATLPVGSPDRKILEYKRITGDNPPAGAFKVAGDETTPVMRQNPRTGAIEQVGTMPKGAHVMTEPPEKQPRPEPVDHWQLHEVADEDNPGKTKLVEYNSKTGEFRDTALKPKAPKKTGTLTPEQKVVYAAALKRRQIAATHWYGSPNEAQQKQIEADALAEAKSSSGEDAGNLTDAQKEVIKALQAR